jgi:hypothetical protein
MPGGGGTCSKAATTWSSQESLQPARKPRSSTAQVAVLVFFIFMMPT